MVSVVSADTKDNDNEIWDWRKKSSDLNSEENKFYNVFDFAHVP